jgi:hypothetical protein
VQAENPSYYTTDTRQKRGKVAAKQRGGAAKGGVAGRQGAFPTGVKMTANKTAVVVQPTTNK